jgi:hypothetical protein
MKLLPIANLVALAATIGLNGWSNNGLVPGKNIGAVSRAYDTLFAPAGLTFAIWGVIYLWLLVWAGYQLFGVYAGKPAAVAANRQVGIWFVLSCVFNSLWLVAWLQERLGLSLVLMLGLLGSLLVIYLRQSEAGLTGGNTWLLGAPFSIYLAWICVATIANTSAWLAQVAAFSAPEAWTMGMIGVATVLGAALTVLRADGFLPWVFIWAFWGIALKHSGDPIRWVAWGGMAAVFIAFLFTLRKTSQA